MGLVYLELCCTSVQIELLVDELRRVALNAPICLTMRLGVLIERAPSLYTYRDGDVRNIWV
jgi:hypothetical protein